MVIEEKIDNDVRILQNKYKPDLNFKACNKT